MQREDVKLAMVIAAGIVAVGLVLTSLSVVSMRMAYHRAYSEIASSCQQVSLLTVAGDQYSCAPVARVESATPHTAEGRPGTRQL
jgi:hypothetical protein